MLIMQVEVHRLFRQLLMLGVYLCPLIAASLFADVEISCSEDHWPAELKMGASVEDLTIGSGSAQIVVQLPIRGPNLELEDIHLRRFEGGRRTLWIGLSFEELEENKSWTSIEIARTDIERYELVAQYRVVGKRSHGCASYEFPIDLAAS